MPGKVLTMIEAQRCVGVCVCPSTKPELFPQNPRHIIVNTNTQISNVSSFKVQDILVCVLFLMASGFYLNWYTCIQRAPGEVLSRFDILAFLNSASEKVCIAPKKPKSPSVMLSGIWRGSNRPAGEPSNHPFHQPVRSGPARGRWGL